MLRAGQLLDTALIIWRQINVDIFFVDWEKKKRVAESPGFGATPRPARRVSDAADR